MLSPPASSLIGAAVDLANHLALRDVEYADAVGASVRRRQFALIYAWRSKRRTAQRDEDQLAIGARMNAPAALSQRQGRQRFHLDRVDHRQVAGGFVRDIDAVR